MGKFKPSIPKPIPGPTPEELEMQAQEKASKEAAELRAGRVKTILTSGQGLEEDAQKKRKTVLGG